MPVKITSERLNKIKKLDEFEELKEEVEISKKIREKVKK